MDDASEAASRRYFELLRRTYQHAASDILVDGTQDPTKECNGVSIGIGFEAVEVTASGVQAEPPPAPDPCL